jgi:hypothetical protein
MDREIYNRKELQFIFLRIGGQFIEEVFNKIQKSKKFPTLPKLISVDRQIYNRKELHSIFLRIGGQFIDEVFNKIQKSKIISHTSKNHIRGSPDLQ